MSYSTLVPVDELARHLGDSSWAVVDLRHSLAEPERGYRDYRLSHVPGAVFAELDRDLSGPIVPGKTGRHPLPDVALFAETLSRWGIDASTQVVCLDDSGGSMAARLWWMLRWLDHDAVAVLDGGWQAWRDAGYPIQGGDEVHIPRRFVPVERPNRVVSAVDIEIHLLDRSTQLFDARALDRYRGENETIDPVGGHIPGAASLPYTGNLEPNGRFKSPEALRERFHQALGGALPEDAVFYCGSGVSATHNLLALAHAGLGVGRLYAGSWSDWISDPKRPVATGSA